MRILALALVLLIGLPAHAQSSLAQDGHIIYFSAIPTLDLDASVARGYAISRSANRALLNIAVRRVQDGGDVAVAAQIRGSVQNDVGQPLPLAIREVREGNDEAIYYLGEPRMRPGDTLRFDLLVTPEGSERAISVRFSRSFPR